MLFGLRASRSCHLLSDADLTPPLYFPLLLPAWPPAFSLHGHGDRPSPRGSVVELPVCAHFTLSLFQGAPVKKQIMGDAGGMCLWCEPALPLQWACTVSVVCQHCLLQVPALPLPCASTASTVSQHCLFCVPALPLWSASTASPQNQPALPQLGTSTTASTLLALPLL